MNDMKTRQRHGLTHHAVRAISKLIEEGVSQKEIAERFGVSRETISAIKNFRVYGHVTRAVEQEEESSNE
jgi:DNA-binding CsgD family transcriptional regulator